MSVFLDVIEMINQEISDLEERKVQYTSSPADFTRQRKSGFGNTIKAMLGMQDKTLSKELYDGQMDISVSAFIKNRDKISTVAFADLFHNTAVKMPYAFEKDENGLVPLAVDGTEFPLLNQDDSAFSFTDKNGLVCRHLYVHLLYNLKSRTVIDVVVAPKSMPERKALNIMIDRYDGPPALIIGDRGYYSYNVLEHIKRNGRLEFLFRTPNKSSFKEVNELPLAETDTMASVTVCTKSRQYCDAYGYRQIPGASRFGRKKKTVAWDFDTEPSTLTFRICRFMLDSGEYETIITSLTKEKCPLAKVKETYFSRWGIETANRYIKYDVGALSFHSRKDSAVIKEIYIALIAFNTATATALSIEIPASNKAKHERMISLTFAIHVCIDLFRHFRAGIYPEDPEPVLLKHLSLIRPGRKHKRQIRIQSARLFLYRAA